MTITQRLHLIVVTQPDPLLIVVIGRRRLGALSPRQMEQRVKSL